MTGPELKAALRELGLTQRQFAELTGEHITTINKRVNEVPGWPIPRYVATIVELLQAGLLRRLPPLRDPGDGG